MFTKIARSLRVFRIRQDDWTQREAEAARLLADYRPATMVGYAPRVRLVDRCPTMLVQASINLE